MRLVEESFERCRAGFDVSLSVSSLELSPSSASDARCEAAYSEKIKEPGREMVGDRGGTISGSGKSKYDAAEGMFDGVQRAEGIDSGRDASFLRHLITSQSLHQYSDVSEFIRC